MSDTPATSPDSKELPNLRSATAADPDPAQQESKVHPCRCPPTPSLGEGSDATHQFGPLWGNAPPFTVSWGSISCRSHVGGPAHNGRGTYVYRLSPSGDVSALAVNERKARNSRVLFFSSLTPGELSSAVYPSSEEDRKTGR